MQREYFSTQRDFLNAGVFSELRVGVGLSVGECFSTQGRRRVSMQRECFSMQGGVSPRRVVLFNAVSIAQRRVGPGLTAGECFSTQGLFLNSRRSFLT